MKMAFSFLFYSSFDMIVTQAGNRVAAIIQILLKDNSETVVPMNMKLETSLIVLQVLKILTWPYMATTWLLQ